MNVKFVTSKKKLNKKLIPFLFAGTLLLLFLVIILIARLAPSDNNSFSQKQDCPFQCCTNSKYYDKQCPLDYECRNNNCYEKDTDGDGLSDRYI